MIKNSDINEKMRLYTYIPEMDNEILKWLDDLDLYHVCRVNHYSAALCWSDKILRNRCINIRFKALTLEMIDESKYKEVIFEVDIIFRDILKLFVSANLGCSPILETLNKYGIYYAEIHISKVNDMAIHCNHLLINSIKFKLNDEQMYAVIYNAFDRKLFL